MPDARLWRRSRRRSGDSTRTALRAEFGRTEFRGRLAASLQGALIEPLEPGGSSTGGRFDASVRLSLRHTTDRAIRLGLVGEFDRVENDADGFDRDEFYVYVSSDWGRLELGENDGAADRLSLHAPSTGLDQVRGDFARYAGTRALFSPYDSRDAVKLTWLSPPSSGWRAGLSFAPEFVIDEDDPDPADRLRQERVIEAGLQRTLTIRDTVIGISAALVRGSASDPAEREDIDSVGLGTQLSHGRWMFGVAYVDRNRSNLRPGAEPRTEWNAGIEYTDRPWSVAASVATGEERGGSISRYGFGGVFSWTDNAYVALDLVRFEERPAGDPVASATTGLLELGLRY